MNFLLVKFKFLKFSFGKSVCALFTIFLIFFIVGGVLYLFIPIVIQQAVVLSKVDFNSISSALQEPIEKVNTWLRSLGLEPGASAADQVKGLVGEYIDWCFVHHFYIVFLS